jgi:hypothetical protein
LIYLSGEAPAFMSMVQPLPIDKEGLELVSDEGGVPLHLDLYSQHRNIALFATTRAGKSVLVAGILVPALAQDIPVTIMDFPPSDAASTFKNFTSYVGGAYLDSSLADLLPGGATLPSGVPEWVNLQAHLPKVVL